MFFFPAVIARLEKTRAELLVNLRQKLVGLDAETADLSNPIYFRSLFLISHRHRSTPCSDMILLVTASRVFYGRVYGRVSGKSMIVLVRGVILLEGIDLSEVDPGRYELMCLPIRLQGSDGAPCRAVLRELQD